MADLKARYPLATADGVAIPNDTIRPAGVYSIALTDSAGTTELALPSEYNTIVLYATTSCIIRFGGVAVAPSTTVQVDSVCLPASTLMTVSPPVMSISGITIAGTGMLFVTIVESWAGLGLELQNTRR